MLNEKKAIRTEESEENPVAESQQQKEVTVTPAAESDIAARDCDGDRVGGSPTQHRPGVGRHQYIRDSAGRQRACGSADLPRCVLEPLGWKQPDPNGGDLEKCSEVPLGLLDHIDMNRYFDHRMPRAPRGGRLLFERSTHRTRDAGRRVPANVAWPSSAATGAEGLPAVPAAVRRAP